MEWTLWENLRGITYYYIDERYRDFNVKRGSMSMKIYLPYCNGQNGDINTLSGGPVQFHTLDLQVSMGGIDY